MTAGRWVLLGLSLWAFLAAAVILFMMAASINRRRHHRARPAVAALPRPGACYLGPTRCCASCDSTELIAAGDSVLCCSCLAVTSDRAEQSWV